MPVQIRIDGDTVVLSNFGRLMDDPRHFDASKDVDEMLAQGFRNFVLDLRGVGELGPSGVGLLMTITRRVRQDRGDAVLASPSRTVDRLLEEWRLETFWETFENVDRAKASFDRRPT